jgi:hypothetical protein
MPPGESPGAWRFFVLPCVLSPSPVDARRTPCATHARVARSTSRDGKTFCAPPLCVFFGGGSGRDCDGRKDGAMAGRSGFSQGVRERAVRTVLEHRVFAPRRARLPPATPQSSAIKPAVQRQNGVLAREPQPAHAKAQNPAGRPRPLNTVAGGAPKRGPSYGGFAKASGSRNVGAAHSKARGSGCRSC